jgi:aspartyl-tRNA(Asn)/glutamyl-tRNA(Gln) amidotransferase subunit C
MKLEKKDLQKLSKLSKLSLDETEEEDLLIELSSVLSWVSILKSAKTKDASPMSHPEDVKLKLREDISFKTISTDDALSNAPKHSSNHFIVPRVIE